MFIKPVTEYWFLEQSFNLFCLYIPELFHVQEQLIHSFFIWHIGNTSETLAVDCNLTVF